MEIIDLQKKEYLECGLPKYLELSLANYKIGLEKKNSDKNYCRFDCDFCDLQSSINSAEADQEITENQAWYLREKYLGLTRSVL